MHSLVSTHSLINGNMRNMLFVLAFLAACRDEAPAPIESPFSKITITSVEPSEGLPIIPCPIEAAAMLSLVGLTEIQDRPAITLSAVCYQLPDGGCGVTAKASLEVILIGEPELEFDAESEVRDFRCSQLLLTTARAIRTALKKAVAQQKISKSDADVIAALEEEGVDREVLLAAIDAAGDRKIFASVPLLTSLFGRYKDELVLLRATGALGRIGDPAVIKFLGRVALSGPKEIAYAALRAIADIGGPEAERGLQLVINHSTNLLVTLKARQLLKEMEVEAE